MAVYEKRGYIKEYDESGKLVSKTPLDQPVEEEIVVEEPAPKMSFFGAN